MPTADPAPADPSPAPATDPAPAATARGSGALVRDRRFGSYVVGQWLSNTGNWFHNVAAGIVVFELTGSNTLVGVVGGLQFVFMLVLAPYAGSLGDRVDRRRLLLGGQVIGLVGAVGLAVVALTVGLDRAGGVWPVVAATAVIGIGYAVSVPTIQAYVPSLVPSVDLPQAIALNSVTFNLARAIGPAAAGALVAGVGAGWSFGVNALSFAIFTAVLVVLGRVPPPAAPADDQGSGGRAGGDQDASALAGLRLARQDRVVLTVLLGTVAVGFASDPVNTLAPALAARLGEGDWLVGAIGSAFGGGATLSAVFNKRLREAIGSRPTAILGLVGVGAGMAAGGAAPTVPLLLVAMAVAGAGFIQAVSQLNTALQLHVDDRVRGRVMALWSVAFLGVRPVAAGLDGVVADAAGVPVAMALAGSVAGVGAAGLWVTRSRSTRAGA
ncbi:MFS transporter [Euzebya sp.]|uniref:MFS transporter n=1 Tax=Euzebya sp. TaxID=1971409 RepID=UPI003514CC38